jgi:uncharacterized membrane protein
MKKGVCSMSVLKTMVPMAWDLGSFLQHSTETLKQWGGYLIILIGVVMVIASVYQIAKGLISHGKTQTNWAIAIILLILGGAFMVGGFSFVSNIASGGRKTIEDLGQTILPMLMSF